MNFIKIKLFYLFLISFSCIYAMDMDLDLDKPLLSSQVFAESSLETAIDNADLEWLKKNLTDLIKKYPKILHGKFPYNKNKIDIRALIIVYAAQAKIENNDDKYMKYLDMYELLLRKYSVNLLSLDNYSNFAIAEQTKNNIKLKSDLDSINKKPLKSKKRSIYTVDGKIAQQESKRFKSE